jgi:uncharacterized protein (TIGR00288 family)
MMLTPGTRMPYGAAPTFHAPNAALLIDFDNVTMGIRSDLGKELKSLLKSDVIRGKVAVQRAYADWRRYPQYIVPLTESSIDLIFAPAYGSSKKNATDLRMAIDAIELVFTRPEIGTFILMTGDSDFSSCVLKLKEYGKYVIGVGMRESSSDLLIQNCDEYYSYHSLYGMTRAGEVTESSEDPWVLVRRAVQQMAANGDVMRTDRLKQVMLDLDHGFDEKKVGYNKFSLFVREAANKGLLRLKRGENGQQELLPMEAEESSAEPVSAPPRRPRRDDSRRGGRREPRTSRPEPIESAPFSEAPVPEETGIETEAVIAEAPGVPVAAVVSEPAAPPVAAPAVEATKPEPTATAPVADGAAGLKQAYSLLQQAVRNLSSSSGAPGVRDGDVKREMLRLSPGFDEETLGFSKFTRFLRQAHDAEAIDLNRATGGNYEVALPSNGKRLPPPSLPAPGAQAATATAPAAAQAEASPPVAEPARSESPAPGATATAPAVGALRGRRGGRRGVAEGVPPIFPGQVISAAPPALAVEATPEAAPAPEPEAASSEVEQEEPAAKTRSRRGRRGGRGRGRSDANGESNGQSGAEEATPVVEAALTLEEAIAAPVIAPEPSTEGQAIVEAVIHTGPPAAPAAGRARRGRGRGRGAATSDEVPPILPGQAVALPTPAPAEPEAEAPAPAKRGRGRGKAAARPAPQAAPEPAAFSASALGLPEGVSAIEEYLGTAYKGVGKKSAEQLLASFGADVFRVLEEQPERVREVLGDRRAKTLLEQWQADREKRTPAETVAPEQPAKPKSPNRRGGRGRGTKKPAAPAE